MKRGPGRGSRIPSRQTSTVGASQIRVRMYRVGFGDCFLVSVPVANPSAAAEAHAHILIDCGVHSRGDIGTIAKAVDDIVSETGGKLSLIIATHAHQDHISGFDRCAAQFSRLAIGQVWLPWTWDPKDARAVKLQKTHAAVTAQLAAHFAALGATASLEATAAVENLVGNAHALALLKQGFSGGRVRYVKAGDQFSASKSGIPGVSAKILGPPQSEEFLAQMNPPAGQRYLAAGPSGSAEWTNVLRPFVSRWCAARDATDMSGLRLTRHDERQLQTQAASLEALAFALDQARNNESVVALLVVRNRYLLFPGDAQYGNWRWWLENENPESILPEICFFKVAHHGSVNATPKTALEQMSEGKFAAMVSTQSVPWKSIPRVPLMARLSERTKGKIVRSDWIPVSGAPGPARATAPQRPSQLPAGFARGALWFDYIIDT
jgi:beta-lactamase superfamily II metal-dependent hydrolase